MKLNSDAMSQFKRSYQWVFYLAVFLLSLYLAQLLLMGTLFWFYAALPDNWAAPLLPGGALALAIIFAALLRFSFRCPVWNTGLRGWIENTPWTPDRRLPFGPVTLTRNELSILGVCALLAGYFFQNVYPVLLYVAPYCGMMTFANLRTRSFGSVYATVLLTSLIPLTTSSQWMTMALIAAAYFSCCRGYENALRRFPWDASVDREFRLIPASSAALCEYWPLVNRGRQGSLEPQISWKHVWGISLVCAWLAAEMTYLCSITANGGDATELHDAAIGTTIFFALVVACARLLIYGSLYAPISVVGRIATGRLRIPGYDQVFRAPMLILGSGVLIPAVLLSIKVYPEVVVFLTVFTTLALAMGMRPTLAEWVFTGEYRMSNNRPGLPKEWVQTA